MSPTSPVPRYVYYVALTAALGAGGAWMSAPTADEAAVRATLEHYIQGHATVEDHQQDLHDGDEEEVRWAAAASPVLVIRI